MSCFWRKNATAPCACAYKLNAPPAVIFDSLKSLRQGTMVIRQDGLSMMRVMSFEDLENVALEIIRDRISGSETDYARSRDFHILTDAWDSRPQLVSGEVGMPVDLSIRLDGMTWNTSEILRLMATCAASFVDCHTARMLGAGTWLDDWQKPSQSGCEHILVMAAKRELETCQTLKVRVKTSSHRSEATFSPTFIDTDGPILRIADKHCRNVVYVDAESPDFLLHRLSKETIAISRSHSAA